ncbi:MAG: lipoyl synthase, partial [Myxococcota bacterium]
MDTVKTKTLKVNKHRKRQKQILRKPAWLRSQIPAGENFSDLKQVLRTRSLHTVCEEARCPNLGECWGGGTATFMVMGDTCTRGCRFCAVKTAKAGLTQDPDEPHKVAEAAQAMGLRYVVITSVDRDDLPDGGAAHFAEVIREVYRLSEQKQRRMMIEVLTPDFQGVRADVDKIIAAKPTVFAHNVETTEALTRYVRDARSGYRQSLDVLA